MLFHVSMTKIFLLFFGLGKYLMPFYCVIISLRANIHRNKVVGLIRSIKCCNDISNISNSFPEKEEESHVLEKKIRLTFFWFLTPHCPYTIA